MIVDKTKQSPNIDVSSRNILVDAQGRAAKHKKIAQTKLPRFSQYLKITGRCTLKNLILKNDNHINDNWSSWIA